MKVNIKMRVTPEQSKQVQKIVFAKSGGWQYKRIKEIKYTQHKVIFIDENKLLSHRFDDIGHFNEHEFEEVDADLFISTNGTCELDSADNEKEPEKFDTLCLKNSFWDKEKIEYNTDEAPKYYGEVNLELSNNATNPNHYTKMKIAPNEYITANYDCFSWYTANVIKYTSRYKSKNGIEDLEKAIKYLQFEIEELRKAEQ